MEPQTQAAMTAGRSSTIRRWEAAVSVFDPMWPSKLLARGMELVRELKDATYGKAQEGSVSACFRRFVTVTGPCEAPGAKPPCTKGGCAAVYGLQF